MQIPSNVSAPVLISADWCRMSQLPCSFLIQPQIQIQIRLQMQIQVEIQIQIQIQDTRYNIPDSIYWVLDTRYCMPVVACGCLGGVVASGFLWLLGLSGCLWLPVVVWVEWLPVVACGCLG